MSVGEASDAPRLAAVGRSPLYTIPFIGVCLVALLAFAQNFTLQPILPLLVLDLGGDATLVGIAFLVFTVPSVLLRPYIGRLADRIGSRSVLLAGGSGLALAGPLYFVPNLLAIVGLRIAHGTAWAALNTGGPSTLAALAPPDRRGEASATFDLMPGLAVLVMPTVALVLYAAVGLTGPLALATVLGFATIAVAARLIPPSVGTATSRGSSGGSLLEPSAVLPMLYQLLLNSVLSLYVVYPPLFAAQHGLPLSDLVAYYPVYGLAFIVSRIVGGRIVDRVPRSTVMIAGAALSGIALLVTAVASGVLLLTVGGVIYAIANGASAPATTALVMDRAPVGRVGAAMATYTLGFQFGSGLGAALWGYVIDTSGFTLPFLAGAGLQFAMLGTVLARRTTLEGLAT